MLMKEIMESELNKKIRELLELFEINPDIVVGEWNLIGHLKQFIESLLSKQRDLSELVEWKVSKTKEILLDFNGSDSNRPKAVATIIHSEKILEDQAINQVLSIIKDTNEVVEDG